MIFRSLLISLSLLITCQTWAIVSVAHLEALPVMTKAPLVSVESLKRVKQFKNSRDWEKCAKTSETVYSQVSSLQPWVLTAWLQCANRIKGVAQSSRLKLAAMAQVEKRSEWLRQGPWKEELQQEVTESTSQLLALPLVISREQSQKVLNFAFQNEDVLGAQALHDSYLTLADQMQSLGRLSEALQVANTALKLRETSRSREKVASLELALQLQSSFIPSAQVPLVPLSDEEKKFEQRFESSQKNKDWMSFLEDLVSYLNRFPGGVKANFAWEKIQEIFSAISSAKDEKSQNLKDRALQILGHLDEQRGLDFVRWLHRRSDYAAVVSLAQKFLKEDSKSPQSGTLLFLAGRSAQFTGDYKKAKYFFEEYLAKHGGAEDLVEVTFRLGLVHMRQQQNSSAIAQFERVLALPKNERYELNARYWLVRALQWSQNARADEEIDFILTKFPFSYYGLRLLSEKQNGSLEWPAGLKLDKSPQGNWVLTPPQKKALDRMRVLGAANWLGEATQEAQNLPWPQSAELKVLVAQDLARSQVIPPVVKLVNEATDLNPAFRSMDVFQVAYPDLFEKEISQEATKQKLSPVLVKSLIRQESAFGIFAQSTSNAIGLMQLIPPTAKEVASEVRLKEIEVPEDVYLPPVNVQMGTYYLAKMLKTYSGSVPLALAAYNAGPTRMTLFLEARPETQQVIGLQSSDPRVEMWFDEVPWAETSFYVKAILRNTILYRLISKAGASDLDKRRVDLGTVLWSDLVSLDK
ncbi:MAG: transglycosylase SLT domain-containing protein [Proteobacteria bacterium]|nr:transglycosylase SLT domain-containing protein [Pseudomonadota bacterium]